MNASYIQLGMSKLNFSIYQTPFSAQLSLKKTFAKPFDENKSTVKVKSADLTDTKACQLELEKTLKMKNQEILSLNQMIKEHERANDILKNKCEAMEKMLESERKKIKKEKQRV